MTTLPDCMKRLWSPIPRRIYRCIITIIIIIIIIITSQLLYMIRLRLRVHKEADADTASDAAYYCFSSVIDYNGLLVIFTVSGLDIFLTSCASGGQPVGRPVGIFHHS